jgi:hypothetical protein
MRVSSALLFLPKMLTEATPIGSEGLSERTPGSVSDTVNDDFRRCRAIKDYVRIWVKDETAITRTSCRLSAMRLLGGDRKGNIKAIHDVRRSLR